VTTVDGEVRDPLQVSAEAFARASSRAERARAIVVEHFDFIWRLLRRIGVPPAELDDAAQQVFLVAVDRVDDVAIGRERAFLFGTALRVAATARRRRVRESPSPAADAARDGVPLADELTDQKRARELLDTVLDGLDDDLRVIFVLFELDGMKLVEIAGWTGLPLGTVSSRLRRAREQFDVLLRRHGSARTLPRQEEKS
jgi:RNA polymerase sigma-70 factor (ECF subfamily)